ncbi:GNAT family N-acetyltransferase [Halorubrum vacuolatum]|uniref:Acetyltransferase (GNAT) family protein n=1 Tax=Halorubrum vacuolatum TaxID=63740 RepID=A0A238WY34_HALVU|nr:GNAT family N-acetyltransferase [Halorubrum vacuolatum]SNR50519.1 Acetyltransferase (GNAT) family protein [Halorubrum vacuolatum]
MEFAVIGWPGEGSTLRLDYRAFAYAGKFVVGAPGKAVWRTVDGSRAVPDWEPAEPLPETVDPDEFDRDVLAAVAFSPDRTDPGCCRLRYVTVHRARRGEGHGPRLIDRLVPRLADRGYETVRIAVNNPFAYEALYKSGFAYDGERTGIAELELSRPIDAPSPIHDDIERYQDGLDRFRERDLDGAVEAFLHEREGAEPPGEGRG